MSLARITSAISKALVGAEHLAPELKAATKNLVSESGYINQKALGDHRLLGDLIIGKKGTLDALNARYRQGGLIGPGGLVAGEFALDPNFKKLVAALREGKQYITNPYTGEKITRNRGMVKAVTAGAGQAINPLFLLGFPAMEISEALETPGYEDRGGYGGIGGAIGSGLGFAAAGPLGLLGGMSASYLGEGIGRSIGSLADPDKVPSAVTVDPLQNLPIPINSRR